MKKNLLILFTIIFLQCKTNNDNKNYEINGNINITQGYVYLLNYKRVKIDSSKIDGGKFNFTGSLKSYDKYHIKVDTSYYSHSFFLENNVFDININYNPKTTYSKIKFNKGGKLDKVFNEFRKINEELGDKMDSIRKLKKSNEQQMLDSTVNLFRKPYYNLLQKHLNSEIAPYIIMGFIHKENKLKAEYNKLPENIKNSVGGLRLKKKLDNLALVLIKGNYFKGTLFPNVNYKLVNIDSIIAENKITLLDFWASWCAPCREQFPELKMIYENYNKHQFEIIGISSDKNSDVWKKTILSDKLDWLQLLDSTKKAKDIYQVRSLPTSFLVNNKGLVLEKNISTDKLIKVLDSIFLVKKK